MNSFLFSIGNNRELQAGNGNGNRNAIEYVFRAGNSEREAVVYLRIKQAKNRLKIIRKFILLFFTVSLALVTANRYLYGVKIDSRKRFPVILTNFSPTKPTGGNGFSYV
jgi:hypothetical protein